MFGIFLHLTVINNVILKLYRSLQLLLLFTVLLLLDPFHHALDQPAVEMLYHKTYTFCSLHSLTFQTNLL